MQKRRIVFRNLRYRLAAFVLILAASLAVRNYITPDTPTTRFMVKFAPMPETEIGDRDISLYEFGGQVGNCAQIEYAEEDLVKAKACWKARDDARGFLLDHFKNQRRGYVIFERASLGSITPSYVFTEPDGTGEWKIHVRERVWETYRFDPNVNTWYYSEAFRRTLKDDDGYFKSGTSVLVLRSRGVYERIL